MTPVLPLPASASASASASAAAGLHTSAKRLAPGDAGLPLVAMDQCPWEWQTCASCKQSKIKCCLAVGTRLPYVACTACLNRGHVCKPHPLEQKRNKKKKCLPVPPPKLGAVTASLMFCVVEKPALLLNRTLFPTRLPPLPIQGSSDALLGDLISWHTKIERAMAEHHVACLTETLPSCVSSRPTIAATWLRTTLPCS